jgi:hypothetical protein
MGLVITRKGLHKNAQCTQIKEWRDNEKMMICLIDEDLAKMLALKESNEEPWKLWIEGLILIVLCYLLEYVLPLLELYV